MSGKTLLMNQLVNSIVELNSQDFIVVHFNFEMLARNLIIRDLSALTKLTMRELLSATDHKITDEEMKRMREHLEKQTKDFLFFDTPRTTEKMVETIENVYSKYRKDIIMILDHTLLVKRAASQSSTTDMLYALGDTLTSLKKRFPITSFIASQLNREIESIDRRKTPALHYPAKGDLSYSDALYHHSDLVLISHIPALLNLPSYGVDKLPTKEDDVYWHILKNRNNDAINKILLMKANFKNMEINEKTTV